MNGDFCEIVDELTTFHFHSFSNKIAIQELKKLKSKSLTETMEWEKCTESVEVPNEQSIEQVWTKVVTAHGTLFFGATYTALGSALEVYDQVVSTTKSVVESCADEDHIFLVGDFNRSTE